MIPKNMIVTIKDLSEILLAVETLECHSKNWLVGNNEKRREGKIRLIEEIISNATCIIDNAYER